MNFLYAKVHQFEERTKKRLFFFNSFAIVIYKKRHRKESPSYGEYI